MATPARAHAHTHTHIANAVHMHGHGLLANRDGHAGIHPWPGGACFETRCKRHKGCACSACHSLSGSPNRCLGATLPPPQPPPPSAAAAGAPAGLPTVAAGSLAVEACSSRRLKRSGRTSSCARVLRHACCGGLGVARWALGVDGVGEILPAPCAHQSS